MTANEALAELLELSAHVRDVAILGGSGFVLASTGTAERGEQLARVAADLAAAAGDVRPGTEISRIEVSGDGAHVFLVRDGGRVAIATTSPDPIAGLVIYDLRTMLGRIDAEPTATRSRKKKAAGGA
jgi:predicted regulator of Ras-like GTPase activity (Roadblock/LC7/MglB family)